MKKRRTTVLIFLAGVLLSACSKPPEMPEPDGADALKYATELAGIAPRHSGSPGAKKAAEWIVSKASEFQGFEVRTEEFSEQTPQGNIRFRNIVADLPGKSNHYILLAAHYDGKQLDSVPRFQGANDGGSGVGALLAVMKKLSAMREKLPLTLRFVFFDGEECYFNYSENDGLHGSRHHAKQLALRGETSRCRAMILLDMVGDKDLKLTLPADTNPALKQLIRNAADQSGCGIFLNDSGPIMLDDHIPFQKLGIPSADLIDFSYGPENTWWHTDEDTPDKLSAESLYRSMKITLEIIRRLCL